MRPSSLLHYRNLVLGGSIVLVLLLTGLLAPCLRRMILTRKISRLLFTRRALPIFLAPMSMAAICSLVFSTERVFRSSKSSVSVGMALAIGVPLGMISGYMGGLTDQVILWFIDLLYAFPGIVLAILIVAILGPGLFDSLVAISIFSIPVYTRLARNLTLSLKRMEYVEAARALGAGPWRILYHHISEKCGGSYFGPGYADRRRCGVDGVRAELSRARRSASTGGVGSHDGPRPQLSRGRYLSHVLSWRRDHANSPGLEPAGGWLARPARSPLSSTLSLVPSCGAGLVKYRDEMTRRTRICGSL